jgi:hypothetical protein
VAALAAAAFQFRLKPKEQLAKDPATPARHRRRNITREKAGFIVEPNTPPSREISIYAPQKTEQGPQKSRQTHEPAHLLPKPIPLYE